MKRRELCLGCPGTGKTTKLLREIDDLRKQGFALEEIGFVSFTRRAIQEARERGALVFGCAQDDLPWFRTLHSSFARALGMSNWLKRADQRKFQARFGYRLTDGGLKDDDGVGWATDDDRLMAADSYARLRGCSLDEAAAKNGAHSEHLRAFSQRYRTYRREEGKSDFTDVLEEAVRRRVCLPVRALIVDEAQDLCPLQIEALRPTFEAAEVVIVAGDDDQAIFAFQGANPAWIIALSRDPTWRTEVLSRSWRVPVRAHALAQRIIVRCQDRASKSYAPRDAEGVVLQEVDEVGRMLGEIEGKSAYLTRTRAGTRQPAHDLFDRREVPYLVLKGYGPNPLGEEGAVEAVSAAWAVAHGEPITRAALDALLALVPVSGPLALLSRGAKADVSRFLGPVVTARDIDALGLGRLRDHARVARHCEVLLKLPPGYRAWFATMWQRYGCVPKPQIVLSTIHAAKGAEWPTVVVSPDHPKTVELSQTSSEGRDAEHRVAYVAVTRAKERLIIARRRGKYGYAYP